MSEDQNLTIKKWAEEDRPREKLILKGKSALSDAELIAILIGSGSKELSAVELSRKILNQHGNDLNQLAKLTLPDLQKFNGIGEAKAISIISALELGRRRKESEPQKKVQIKASSDAYNIMKPHLLDLSHEEFWAIFLNRSNQVIRTELISSGGVSGTLVDAKILFKKALEHTACSVILAHNHPSGNLSPSRQDIDLTKRLTEAGKALDIPVLDHLIFTDQDYFSFSDESLL